MFNKKETSEEQNFWVSYADLMAGLLFVFILVLGAILIKYISIENNLSGKNVLLDNVQEELLEKNNLINDMTSQLQKKNDLIISLEGRLEANNDLAINLENQLKNSSALVINLEDKLQESQNYFDDEKKLNQELNLENKNISLEIETIQTNNKELISQIEDINILVENKKNLLEMSKNEISKLQETITNQSNIISVDKDKLLKVANIVLIQKNKYKSLVDEFNIAKSKVKALKGIRVKVIKELKKKLGNSINVDSKSGAIRFSSNVLFDQNKFKLKEKSKKILSKTLKKYIKAILHNKKIKKYIDKIIIEGHTNTDGSYLHNLELSQKRALEVMKFLYSLEPKNQKLLREYISASGRSYSNTVKFKNKKENKNASRRIEIKFLLKNEKSIKQLSKYLNQKRI